jgi:large subunit ribosomal protein L3
MSIGLVAQKCGMTRIFTDDGRSIPVTVLNATPNRVVQVKTPGKDGYRALQVTAGDKRISLLNKPLIGHFAKANVTVGRGLWEFRVADGKGADIAVGNELNVDIFTVGSKVDVTSFSKGKGFAGVVKRYNFATQDATHGNSLSHRAPGSIGQRQDPGRVFKGKKMAGHMGDVRCTIQNQEIVCIDKERNLLFINGAIPGARGADVIVKPAVKTKGERGGT